MPNETIADIVREMRDYNDTPPPRRAWIDLSERIESAAKRSRCGCDDSCEQFRELERENDRLRAALKQVLSFDIDTHPCDGYCVMLNAVREAQRIAREGEAK